jgi:hypothetical protein
LRTSIRAVKIVVRDGRILRPVRRDGALGLLSVPGPFDEIVLFGVGGRGFYAACCPLDHDLILAPRRLGSPAC